MKRFIWVMPALALAVAFMVSVTLVSCDTGGGGSIEVTANNLVLPAGQAWLQLRGTGGWQFRADGTAVELSKESGGDRDTTYYITGNYEWEIDNNGVLWMRMQPSVFLPNSAWSKREAVIRGTTLTLGGGAGAGDFTPQAVNIVR